MTNNRYYIIIASLIFIFFVFCNSSNSQEKYPTAKSSIKYQASSIKHQASSINYQLSSTRDTASIIIDSISIVGRKSTRKSVILRELNSKIGEKFDPAIVSEDSLRLLNLGIFASVDISIEPNKNQDDSLTTKGTLIINVRERWTTLPSLYLAHDNNYDLWSGWTIGPGITATNFLGMHHYLNLLSTFGRYNTYSITWSTPWIAKYHIPLGLKTYRTIGENKFEKYTQKTIAGDIWSANYFTRRFFVNVGIGRRIITGDSSGIEILNDRFYDGTIAMGYDKRDLSVDPSKGYYIYTAISKVGGWLTGNVDYNRYYIDLRYYKSVWFKHTIAMGTNLYLQNFQNPYIPLYSKIYLGGPGTVRGYTPGTADEGTNRFVYSIEYRFHLTPKYIVHYPILGNVDIRLGGVIFMDTGTAWNDNENPSIKNFSTSIGFGLQAFVPIQDALRLEFGFTDRKKNRSIVSYDTGMKF